MMNGMLLANPFRGFSGHWMVFYLAALAILYSATKENASETRCLNGHLILQAHTFTPGAAKQRYIGDVSGPQTW